MGFDDFTGNSKADAHPAFFLGVEHPWTMRQCRGGKPRSGIGKTDPAVASHDAERATGGHGLDGVDNEIADNLAETSSVGCDGRAATGGKLDSDAGVVGHRRKGTDSVGKQRVKRDGGFLRRVGSGEEHPLVDKALDGGGFGNDGGVGGKLGVQANGGNGILDFMSQRSGHLAEHGESLSFEIRDNNGPTERDGQSPENSERTKCGRSQQQLGTFTDQSQFDAGLNGDGDGFMLGVGGDRALEADFDTENLREVIGKTISWRDMCGPDEVGISPGECGKLGRGLSLVGGVEEQQKCDRPGDDEEKEWCRNAKHKIGS